MIVKRTVALALLLALAPISAGAADTGVIEGVVRHGITEKPLAGVQVELIAGNDSGEIEFRRNGVSDADGRYRFPGLPSGDGYFYTLDARFQDGTFAGGAVTIPDDTERVPVIDTTMRVWPTTTDPSVILIRRDDMFVVSNERGAAVIESVTVANTATKAYIGRGQALSNDPSGASLGLALPPGARDIAILESDIDIPELVPIGAGAAATVAIPPGETRVTFSYSVPTSAGNIDLSRPALYPTVEFSVFAEEPLEVRSNRLSEAGEVTLDGTRYRRWSATDELDAGDPLQVLAVATGSVPVAPLAAAAGAIVLALLFAWILRHRSRARLPALETAEGPR